MRGSGPPAPGAVDLVAGVVGGQSSEAVLIDDGTAVAGSEMQINTTTLNRQMHPAVAWNGVNNFLVVWTSFAGASGFDVYGQAYNLNP